MNKWRLLLFAVFCIFQPIYSENLFNGRERCLQRPDFYRQDSRLLDDSKARPEIRIDRSRREFFERVNDDGLRYSERNFNNRAESIRSEDRRLRSNDRIRVSSLRQKITDNENGRLDRRSSGNERSQLRNIRDCDERRSNTEGEVRKFRLTHSLTQEDLRNEGEDRSRNTLSRDSRFVYAPNRSVERRFGDIKDPLIRSRQGRDSNERSVLRSPSKAREDDRSYSDSDRFMRREDSSRRSNERTQREFQNVPENRRQNLRSKSDIREKSNEIRRQRNAAARRMNLEQRSAVQKRESDESRALRRESRESSDESNERIIRNDNSRRQINERLTRSQRNSPANRLNNARSELSRDYNEETNRRSFAFDRTYERESVQRRESVEYRNSRKESRNNANQVNERYIRSDDLARSTNEGRNAQRNIRYDFIKSYNNAEFNRRSSPVARYYADQRNDANEYRYVRREARNSDKADYRFDSHSSRNSRQDIREIRLDVQNNVEIGRRNSPVSEMNLNARIDYLQRMDTSRDIRREVRAQRSASTRRNNNMRNISERRESAEISDDAREPRPESRRNSDIRFEDIAQRINERLQFQNRREARRSPSIPDNKKRSFAVHGVVDQRQWNYVDTRRNFHRELRDFVPIVRDVVEKRGLDNLDVERSSRQNVRDSAATVPDVVQNKERYNVEARRNFRHEVRDFVPFARNVVVKRERDNVEAQRNFRGEIRDSVSIARDVVRKREQDNIGARRDFRRDVRDSVTIARDLVEKRDRDNVEIRRDFRRGLRDSAPLTREVANFRREVREPIPIARDLVEKRERDMVEARRDFRRELRDSVPLARDVVEQRERDNLEARRNFRREVRDIRLDESSRRNSEMFVRVGREALSRRIRNTDTRAPNELRQDNRRVDDDRRTARVISGNREAREENEPARYIRDNERTKERSLDRTIRSSQNNRISKERISDDDERRFNRVGTLERRFIKNTFERNMERDSSTRLLESNRRERDSRIGVSRDSRNSAKDIRNNSQREEIRSSMPPHKVTEEATLTFKWQNLLYLLQAVYIIGLLAKPHVKENISKKTGFGIWNHSPKLIKVD